MTTTAELNHQDAKDELPVDWRWARLDEVCDFLDSQRVPVNGPERSKRIAGKKQSQLYPYYGANGQVGWIDDFLFDEPLILLAEDGGNFGSKDRPIAYGVSGRCWVNNHAHVLKPHEDVDFDYCLQALRIRPDVGELVSGSTRAKLNQEIASGILVPIPPLSEQKRIAGILREQMAAVDAARRSAEAQLEAAQALPAAYLRAVFDNAETKQWPRKAIHELIASRTLIEHQDGNHGELHPRNRDFLSSGVKFVTVKHVQDDGSVLLDEAPCISQEQASGLRIGFAKARDVLLAHNASVGAVGLAPASCEPFIVGTSLTIYRPDANQMLPEFLFFALKAEEFQRQLADAMKQTTRNQVPITRQRHLTLPLPPHACQRQVSTELSEHVASADRLGESLEAQLEAIDKLPAALLRRAFSGEL